MPLDDFPRLLHGQRYHPDTWHDLADAARRLGYAEGDLADRAVWSSARAEAARRWQSEHAEALQALTEQVERDGVFGDRYRRF